MPPRISFSKLHLHIIIIGDEDGNAYRTNQSLMLKYYDKRGSLYWCFGIRGGCGCCSCGVLSYLKSTFVASQKWAKRVLNGHLLWHLHFAALDVCYITNNIDRCKNHPFCNAEAYPSSSSTKSIKAALIAGSIERVHSHPFVTRRT